MLCVLDYYYCFLFLFFFFFNDTATTEIYTLSLHDALPICRGRGFFEAYDRNVHEHVGAKTDIVNRRPVVRSEEHTSELQSHVNLVCRLLLEKKKKNTKKKSMKIYKFHTHINKIDFNTSLKS